MRVYYTPDFSRKAEVQEKREQNIIRMLDGYLKKHDRAALTSNSTVKMFSTNEKNLFILRLHDLRIFASFQSDDRGEYVILVDFEK